jgi:hypothetical protein
MTLRPRSIVAICVVAGVALWLGITALALTRSPTRTSTAGARTPQGGGPFVDGIEVPTIVAAEALFGRHIIRPSHSEVNDSAIRHIYFERIPGDPNDTSMSLRADIVHVAIEYQGGVLITVELEAGTQSLFDLDPASQYGLMVGDTPGAKTTMVLGAPAMTFPRNSSGPAVVDVTIRGERVVIYGDNAPLEVTDLLDMAQALF